MSAYLDDSSIDAGQDEVQACAAPQTAYTPEDCRRYNY